MKKSRQNIKKSTSQRLIMISLDAVGQRDLAYLCTLPNFKRLWERAAKCAHVQSVYPSITYPAHVSIVTGKNRSITESSIIPDCSPNALSRTGSGRENL